MNKILLETEILNELLPATSKDKNRPNLQGIYIRDIDDTREYIASNGHILLFYKGEKHGGTIPPSGILLKLPHKLKPMIRSLRYTDILTVEFEGEKAHCYHDNTTPKEDFTCEVEFSYYDGLLEAINRTTENAEKSVWLPFQPRYLEMICDFFHVMGLHDPKVDIYGYEKTSPARWDYDNKIAILMPVRI